MYQIILKKCDTEDWRNDAKHSARAVQLIEFDSHAHLVSKAGSVIGGKSPSPVFKLSCS